MRPPRGIEWSRKYPRVGEGRVGCRGGAGLRGGGGGQGGAGLQVFGEPDVAPPRQPARGPVPVQVLPTPSSPLVLPAPLHQIHLWLSWPTVRVPQLVHGLWGALLPPGVRTCGHSWASSLETLIARSVFSCARGYR